MKILVINAGSSSLKYQLIDMKTEEVMAKGNCERIGLDGSFLTYKTLNGLNKKIEAKMQNHMEAFSQVKDALLNKEYGVINRIDEVCAIGHRVVQGGSKFTKSTLINDEVIDEIKRLIPLAPLHNVANLQGINACIETFGKDVPQVAVFDTAFHSTMPQKAYIFSIPYEYYEKYQIRRYGFHGTSHRYVSDRCAEFMGKDIKDLKIISCHLGNGSSICAINKGKVIDTSMGFTPLDGFMMGTRSGSLDPSVVTFIAQKENKSPQDMDDLLNKKSGLLGVSGISSDDRDITDAASEGNERAILAHSILRYQIAKFIGGYAAALNGCDAIIFTAGLGENQPEHRQAVCESLKFLGVEIDKELNNLLIRGKEGKISTPNSKIQVFVIPTNEELVIARDTKDVVLKK
ncbi:MAG: Acetate kinase [Eubacteriales bacterium SKADARSKE-1]|nr:Acetate kinase [Eubacteriales bacterium SKADARSKE-1]